MNVHLNNSTIEIAVSNEIIQIDNMCEFTSNTTYMHFVNQSVVFFKDTVERMKIVASPPINVSIVSNVIHVRNYTGWIQLSVFSSKLLCADDIVSDIPVTTNVSLGYLSADIPLIYVSTETIGGGELMTVQPLHVIRQITTSNLTSLRVFDSHIGNLHPLRGNQFYFSIQNDTVFNSMEYEQVIEYPSDCFYRHSMFWRVSDLVTENTGITLGTYNNLEQRSREWYSWIRRILVLEEFGALYESKLMRQELRQDVISRLSVIYKYENRIRIAENNTETFNDDNNQHATIANIVYCATILSYDPLDVSDVTFYNQVSPTITHLITSMLGHDGSGYEFMKCFNFYMMISFCGSSSKSLFVSQSTRSVFMWYSFQLWLEQSSKPPFSTLGLTAALGMSRVMMQVEAYSMRYLVTSNTKSAPPYVSNIVGSLYLDKFYSSNAQNKLGSGVDVIIDHLFPLHQISIPLVDPQWIRSSINTRVSYSTSFPAILAAVKSLANSAVSRIQFANVLSYTDVVFFKMDQLDILKFISLVARTSDDASAVACTSLPEVYASACAGVTCCQLDLTVTGHSALSTGSVRFRENEKLSVNAMGGMQM